MHMFKKNILYSFFTWYIIPQNTFLLFNVSCMNIHERLKVAFLVSNLSLKIIVEWLHT